MQKQTTPRDRRYLKAVIVGFLLLLALFVVLGLVTKPDTPFT